MTEKEIEELRSALTYSRGALESTAADLLAMKGERDSLAETNRRLLAEVDATQELARRLTKRVGELMEQRDRILADRPAAVRMGKAPICPVLPIFGGPYRECQREGCAWWSGERCCVREIGRWALEQMVETERQELREIWRTK